MNAIGGASIAIGNERISSMLSMLRDISKQASPLSSSVATTKNVSPATQNTPTVNFSDIIKTSLNRSNALQTQAQQLSDQFASGGNVSISEVSIALQKANINLQFTIQARNKIVAAYNEIMNMQI